MYVVDETGLSTSQLVLCASSEAHERLLPQPLLLLAQTLASTCLSNDGKLLNVTAFGHNNPNTLAVCADCGIHFVAKCNEQLTFWPDGTQPWEKISFAAVEEHIYKHLKYGSPLMI